MRRSPRSRPRARSAAALLGLVLLALPLTAACSHGGAAEPAAVRSSLTAQANRAARSPHGGHTAGRGPFRPRHVVVVVEENHARSQVMDSPAAPYLRMLGRDGATFTHAYGVAHPSEPNYLALFSGSTHGVTSDACPLSFTGPNLAAQLLHAHRRFIGYAEGLPAVGYGGCSSGAYARKHAPWTDFPALPSTVGRPWSQSPSDFTRLPSVAFVIPDLDHDMHDGTVAQADQWLRTNLGAYAAWAKRNDSLLVVTWDEDDDTAQNQIPLVIYGSHVRPGTYPEPADHYRLLRTLEGLEGLPPLGTAAQRTPISDIWTR